MFRSNFIVGFNYIFLRNIFGGMDDLIGKVAVVGDDEEPFGIFVKTSNGKKALFYSGEEVEDQFRAASSPCGADIPFRFVEDIVKFRSFLPMEEPLTAMSSSSLTIVWGTLTGMHLRRLSLRNQFFTGPSRGYAAAAKYLLSRCFVFSMKPL